MKRTAFLCAAFLTAAIPAGAKIMYDVPIDWVRIETQGDYEEAYQTSLDPAARVFVLVRGVDTEGVPAGEWAASESAAMKRRGVQTGRALQQHFGDTDWWYVDWKDVRTKENGRRYFLDVKGPIAEVSLLAREEIFKAADASEFDAFLASFTP